MASSSLQKSLQYSQMASKDHKWPQLDQIVFSAHKYLQRSQKRSSAPKFFLLLLIMLHATSSTRPPASRYEGYIKVKGTEQQNQVRRIPNNKKSYIPFFKQILIYVNA